MEPLMELNVFSMSQALWCALQTQAQNAHATIQHHAWHHNTLEVLKSTAKDVMEIGWPSSSKGTSLTEEMDTESYK
jgi:hypothetical protein